MNRRLSPERYMEKGKAAFLSIRGMLLFCLAATFFWGLLAHAYGFFHSSLSHDVLNAFSATAAEERWKIELGRFVVPLYRALFRGPLSLPWLLGCLGLLWTGVAVYLVTAIFDVRSRFLTFLIAGVMCTNITYIAQIASYLYEYDFNAFSLLLAVGAAYVWDRDRGWASLLAGALCLLLSVGIYQSYIAVSIVLILWKSVMELFAGREVKDVFLHGLRGLLMLVLALLLYYAVGLLVYGLTGITQAARTSGPGSWADILGNLPGLVLRALHRVAAVVFHMAYKPIYRVLFVLLAVVLGGCALVVIRRNGYPAVRTLLILLLVGLIPLAMGFIYILARGKDVHELMLYAVWFFYVFLLLFAYRLQAADMLPGNGGLWLRRCSCLLVLLLLWQNVVLANAAYVKKELDAEATLSVMTRVVARMEDEERYVPGETAVAFIGAYEHGDITPGMEELHGIIGMQFNHSIVTDDSYYYYNAYRAYFDYVLNCPVQLCSDEEHARLKSDARVAEMPAFPHRDCLQWVDEILVVKMG